MSRRRCRCRSCGAAYLLAFAVVHVRRWPLGLPTYEPPLDRTCTCGSPLTHLHIKAVP